MTPRQIVELWVEAFNKKDCDALAALYTEEATNHQIAESPVHGRAAIREMFEKGFASAEMVCIVENIFQDGEWAILEWKIRLVSEAAVSSTYRTIGSFFREGIGTN